MSDISALIKCGIGGLAVVVGTLIVLSPIITPVAMAVGVVAAPVFGAKALCHKATLHSLKNKKNFRDEAALNKNQLKQLVQEKRKLKSLDKARSFGLCIIPFGFLHSIFSSSPRARRIQALNEAITDHKRIHP